MHAAFTNEQYWRDRLAQVGGSNPELTDFSVSDSGTVTVAMTQSILAADLPPMVTMVRPGDLVIKRTATWAPLEGGQATGTFTAEVEGTPARVTGTQTLATVGEGSAVSYDGAAEVKIPLVGGKIESAVADEIVKLLEREDEFTGQWLAG